MYTIRSTDKVTLEEFDLKNALFKHMHKNRTTNRNPANFHLYHALIKALIADEDVMDKEVKDRVKDHKRKHDSDNDKDDDDDEGPSCKVRRKKPQDFDASASKQYPTLTSTDWQITNTRDVVIDSSMHRSEPESGHSEHSSDDILKQDEGHVLDLEDTDNAHIPKVPSSNGSADEHERRSSAKLIWKIDECHKLLTNKVDLINPEGHQILRNIYEPLPLGGPPGQANTKINLERPNWDAANYFFKKDYTIVPKPRAVIYRDRNDQRKLMRLNEIHKFSDGTLTRVMEKLDHMVKDFHLFEYNKGMETRKWSEDDKRRSKDFITAIEKRLQIRRIFRSLESFVGGRIRDIDYRLINRTT
ncbi:hypothetical protein Tco_0381013 [Tanacetum coccineum]